MKIQLLQPWGNKNIGDQINIDATNGRELINQKWATLVDPNDSPTIADGSNVTLGAKADAPATSADTTPWSGISLLKCLLSPILAVYRAANAAITSSSKVLSVQQVDPNGKTPILNSDGSVPQTVADGKNIALGSITDTAATDSTSIWSSIALLKGLFAKLSSLITLFSGNAKVQTVDASGVNLYPAGKSAVIEVRLTRPADTVQYTANDIINSSVGTPVTLDLANFALANGKGAWITGINVVTNLLNLANSTIRIWLYRTTPSSINGDNVAMTTMDANTTTGRTFIDMTFGPLLTGSDIIIGQVSPMVLMQCDASHNDIQQLVQTLATFAPVSGGFIDFTFTLLQL